MNLEEHNRQVERIAATRKILLRTPGEIPDLSWLNEQHSKVGYWQRSEYRGRYQHAQSRCTCRCGQEDRSCRAQRTDGQAS